MHISLHEQQKNIKKCVHVSERKNWNEKKNLLICSLITFYDSYYHIKTVKLYIDYNYLTINCKLQNWKEYHVS